MPSTSSVRRLYKGTGKLQIDWSCGQAAACAYWEQRSCPRKSLCNADKHGRGAMLDAEPCPMLCSAMTGKHASDWLELTFFVADEQGPPSIRPNKAELSDGHLLLQYSWQTVLPVQCLGVAPAM